MGWFVLDFRALSWKLQKIQLMLQLIIKTKSYTGFVQKSMTLNDIEPSKCILVTKVIRWGTKFGSRPINLLFHCGPFLTNAGIILKVVVLFYHVIASIS